MLRSLLSLAALFALSLPVSSVLAATPFSRLASPSTPSVLVDNFPSSSNSSVSASTPTLYISFHGGKSSGINIAQRYSLSGTLIGDLYSNTCTSQSLRSMLVMADGTLLIANADDDSSRVLQFSACQADGTRTYIQDYATASLDHPYGLATGNGQLYVSSQNINTVNGYSLTDQSFSGVINNFNPDQIRGLAYNTKLNLLYVADKDANMVQAWSTATNSIDTAHSIASNDPIGLYYHETSGKLFIGSSADNSVVLWNPATQAIEQTFTDTNLQHPAGIAVSGDALFVISQTANSLLQFAISTGSLVGVIASNLPDTPEQLIVSDC